MSAEESGSYIAWFRRIYDRLGSGIAGLVGVKGRDGTTIASDTNRLPVEDGALVYAAGPHAKTITSASAEIVAVGSGTRRRDVLITVPARLPTGTVQLFGCHVEVGTAAASTTYYIEAGNFLQLNTQQQVRAVRASGATTDVTIYVLIGPAA